MYSYIVCISIHFSIYLKLLSVLFTTGGKNSLVYFILTMPTFLPRFLDGFSDSIIVPGGFPFGSQIFSSIFVR